MRILKHISLLLLCISAANALAQPPQKDQIGDITVQPVVHGSLVLEYQDQVIYADPYGGAERFTGTTPPTIVLITDIHGDHFDAKTLSSLKLENATLIVPPAVADKMTDISAKETVVLGNGNSTGVNGVAIAAIPMYNLPETEDSRHPKGRGNGYVITLGDQKVYISGDTEDIPEMRALNDIAIAFVCMNMPYTMTVDQAASAVNEFRPAIVYPYHYRGRPDMSDTNKFKALVEENNELTEVRLRNWYPE